MTEITSIDWSKTFRYVGSKIELGVNSGYLGFCAYCKIRNAMKMYHCEVRPTFSRRFKQTIELHPDMNISLHSSAVSSLLIHLTLAYFDTPFRQAQINTLYLTGVGAQRR